MRVYATCAGDVLLSEGLQWATMLPRGIGAVVYSPTPKSVKEIAALRALEWVHSNKAAEKTPPANPRYTMSILGTLRTAHHSNSRALQLRVLNEHYGSKLDNIQVLVHFSFRYDNLGPSHRERRVQDHEESN